MLDVVRSSAAGLQASCRQAAAQDREALPARVRPGLDDDFHAGRIVALAADLAETPIAALLSADGEALCVRGCADRLGLLGLAGLAGTDRNGPLADEGLVVPDARNDPRRRAHPLVAGAAGIRFFAAFPVAAADGRVQGLLCVADPLPRTAFPARARARLRRLAHLAAANRHEDRHEERAQAAPLPEAAGFLAAAPSAMLITDGTGTIVMANPACERMLGYAPGALSGLNVRVIVPARFHGPHNAGMAALAGGGVPRLAGKPVEVTAVRRDGSELPIELSLSSWSGGGRLGIGAILRDISERRNRDARLLRLAHHDARTGLPNRNRLVEELTELLVGGVAATLLAVGIEGLRAAGESFGHAVGDDLIEALAVRLTGRLGADALLARLKGDELAVLLPGTADPIAAQACARDLLSAFAEPIQVGDHPLSIGAAIGAALAPSHGADAEEVLASADLAMHQARRDGARGFRLFEPAMRSAEAARRDFVDTLRLALESRALELHYQPQVDLASGRLCGAEALLRWRHPERGLLPPAEFLAAIDSSVLALSVGLWTIDEACRQAAAWRAAGLPAIRIAVNLFAAQLRIGTLDTVVAEALARHGLPPEALEIEVTETIALRPDEGMIEPLRNLHACGVAIAFDDFGTGFASLSTLKSFPLTKLKIDRSFVRDILTDPHDAAIVKGVLDIGHALSLDVIAEGIETGEQEVALLAMGCRLGQGFLYGRALEAADFTRCLAEGLAKRPDALAPAPPASRRRAS